MECNIWSCFIPSSYAIYICIRLECRLFSEQQNTDYTRTCCYRQACVALITLIVFISQDSSRSARYSSTPNQEFRFTCQKLKQDSKLSIEIIVVDPDYRNVVELLENQERFLNFCRERSDFTVRKQSSKKNERLLIDI